MTLRICSWLACAAVLLSIAAQSFPAAAQSVPRLKARLVSLDGDTMTLERLAAGSSPASTPVQPPGNAIPRLSKGGGSFTPAPGSMAGTAAATPPDAPPDSAAPETGPLLVRLLPDTRYVETVRANFAVLSAGGYAGAAVTERRGRLVAREVFVYPDALRGTGEGRFPDAANGLMINGLIRAVQPAEGRDGGTLTLQYRGSVLSPTGRGASVCEGRATPQPFASPLACSAEAVVTVESGTPVTAMAVGGRDLLVPGVILSVSLAKNTAGDSVTPGVIVEKPQSPN